MQPSTCVRLGAGLAGLAVALGAFGAHAMRGHYGAEQLQTFETAVRYQMYHALALVLCGALRPSGCRTNVAAGCFLLGIVLFSGSLLGFLFLDARWLLPVTPIGGITFLAGWIALAIGCNTAGQRSDATH